MAGKSDFLEDTFLDWYFRAVAHTPPATFYVALFTANPTDAGGGTEVGTGTWTNYARASITRATGSWDASSGGATENTSAISFGTATATGNVTITGFGIYDASTAGNLLYWGTCSGTVANGNAVSFAAGALDITED